MKAKFAQVRLGDVLIKNNKIYIVIMVEPSYVVPTPRIILQKMTSLQYHHPVPNDHWEFETKKTFKGYHFYVKQNSLLRRFLEEVVYYRKIEAKITRFTFRKESFVKLVNEVNKNKSEVSPKLFKVTQDDILRLNGIPVKFNYKTTDFKISVDTSKFKEEHVCFN